MSYEKEGIKQITKDELSEYISKREELRKVVIDVREVEEYEENHIPTVPLLPMSTIPPLLDGFDDQNEYIFVCRSGSRSQQVAKFMKNQGFSKVANYEEGMIHWDGETVKGLEEYITSVDQLRNLTYG